MPPSAAAARQSSRRSPPGGALGARPMPRYAERDAQQRRWRAPSRAAIDERAPLVAEAGTGVGKTFAYLVPLLLSGARALVSTATKSLQDQLFLRDLPRLRDALGVPVRLALLKGRSSYLCLHRLGTGAPAARTLPDRFAVRALARIEAWAQATASGDLAEIEGLDERSPVIPLVTSTRENCLGSECPQYRGLPCDARRGARRWRPTWWSSTTTCSSPTWRCATAAWPSCCPASRPRSSTRRTSSSRPACSSSARTLGTAQVIDFARDLLAVGLQQARGLRRGRSSPRRCDRAARDLRLAAAGRAARRARRRSSCAGTSAAATRPSSPRSTRWSRGLRRGARGAGDGERARRPTSSAWPSARRALRGAGARVRRAGRRRTACAGSTSAPQQARLVESPLDIREVLTRAERAARRRPGSSPRPRWATTRA